MRKALLIIVFLISIVAPHMSAYAADTNNSFSQAKKISLNTTYADNIETSSDVDYFKFTLTSAGYVSISFSHDYVDSGWNYWDVRLYDENKEELICRYYEGNTTATKTTTKIGVPAGVYYIKVTEDYHSDVPYKVKLNYTSSSIWETEWNDTFDTGNMLEAGVAVNGSIMESDDVDYYKISIPSTAYYRVSFSHNYIDSGWDYWKLYLYDSVNEELKCYYYTGNVKSKTEEKIKMSKGTYYIKVINSNYSDKKYTLKLSKYIAVPQITRTKNVASGIQLSWKKASGASGYNIWRKTGNGSWEKVKTTTGTSWTDKNIVNGTKYHYKIYAYNGNSISNYRLSDVIYRLKRPTISSAKNSSSKKIAVSWNKNTKATGYQVKYVTGSTSKIKKITSGKTTKYTVSSLFKGKTYKVYVRAYKTVSGKTSYSAWSEAKTVKVRK